MARRWALALLLVGLHTTRPARGTGAWLETSDLSSMVCDEGDGRLMHPEHALTFIRHRGNTELGTCVIGRPCVFERNIGGLVPGVQYVVVASVTSSRHDWREISISERAIRSIPTNDSQAPVEAQEHQEHQEHRYRGTVFVGDMAAGDHYVVQMSVYDGCAYLRGSGSMRESALVSFSKNLELQVIEVDMDFSPLDFDATENSVTYPWRFFVHIWSPVNIHTPVYFQTARRFVVRLALYRNEDCGQDGRTARTIPVDACTIVDVPSAGREDDHPLTATCDLFYLRDTGALDYGNYSAALFLHSISKETCEDCAPHSVVPASLLGQAVWQTSNRIIRFQPPAPEQTGTTYSDELLLQKARDDQIIRIDSFHGLLGNALLHLGVVFTVAYALGANVIRVPVSQRLVSADLIEHWHVQRARGAFADTLLHVFPGLPEYIRLPIPPSGLCKGEISAESAMRHRLELGNVDVPHQTLMMIQDLLFPFGQGFQYRFSAWCWNPSHVRRAFTWTLLPFLSRLPAEDGGGGWGGGGGHKRRGDTLVLHLRSGNVHTYRYDSVTRALLPCT